MKQSHKTLLLWVFLLVTFFLLYQVYMGSSATRSVPFSEFMSDVRQHHVVEVRAKDREITYRRQLPNRAVEQRETVAPTNWELQRDIIAAGDPQHPIQVTNENDDSNGLLHSVLLSWLPTLFLLGMFLFFMRQLQGGGGKAMSFGKSRARMVNEAQSKVTFADVAGIDEAREEVEEIVAFLKDPKKFRRLGGRIPKGVLMVGSPGTGKTLLARAIAGEAGVPFFTISGSDFVEMFVGVGASRVRDLFEQGKKHAPCIIFIDEIDAVGRHRGAGLGGGHDEREQTLNQLLVEMDGFDGNDGVIIIAATNRPDVLDPAILRPGRFDRRITVPQPDLRGREEILRVHTRKVPLAPEVDLHLLARMTPGFAGAELENLVNEAALVAARQDKDNVGMVDFEMAKDKVTLGVERRNLVMSEDVRKQTAWHEAGHTLVAWKLPGRYPVQKVTIVPRSMSLGRTVFAPEDDVQNMSLEDVQALIARMMGGRAAELVVWGRPSTGASSDLKQATELARQLVCHEGMSPTLGPVFYEESEDHPFLGKGFGGRSMSVSPETAREIDHEVRRILTQQFERAQGLLRADRAALDRIAEALLERETLDPDEIAACVENQPLPVRVRPSLSQRSPRPQAEPPRAKTTSIFPPRSVPSEA